MVLGNHKINLIITQTCTLINDWRFFCIRKTFGDNASVDFLVTTLTVPTDIFHQGIERLKSLQLAFVTMFTSLNPSINPFIADKAFSCFFSLCTDIFRTPLLIAEFVRIIHFHMPWLNFISSRFPWLLCFSALCCARDASYITLLCPRLLIFLATSLDTVERWTPICSAINFCFMPAFQKASI
jgi:hypothetical protein